MSDQSQREPRTSGNVLTVNAGSSSLKSALYRGQDDLAIVFSAKVERIGFPDAALSVQTGDGKMAADERRHLPDHEAALRALLAWMEGVGYAQALRAVGHRVVHGGKKYAQPEIVTDDLIRYLDGLVPIDPTHLPQAIEAIRVLRSEFPQVPQIACFDTAFHRSMPPVAQLYPLPRRFEDAGIIRYGFHGLSYEYIMSELARLDPWAARGRVVVAHLGNGASMAAVHGGESRDTTMGFTPAGGLVMGTRSGDLDPGVLIHLGEAEGMSPEDLSDLVNRDAGLLGVSGTSADMQDLLRSAGDDPRAAQAVDLFCYSARKFLGALAAALGGLDTLVFTGGIGEHAAPVRAGICSELEFFGIRLDPERNDRSAAIISTDDSPVTVRVIPTDEDLMIARHVIHVLTETGVDRVPV